jgi:hypothetical protein
VISRIRDALGSLTGSLLGVLIIGAIAALPVFVVLWVGSALGVGWTIRTQAWLAIWIADAFAAANSFLPPWAWFTMFTLAWLAFLDVHVRALVRDELSKHLKADNERGQR